MTTGADDADDHSLAQELYDRWRAGEAKSRLEIETWGDATAHGRHFDRFVRTNLGVATTKPSRQSDEIADLRRQVRALGSTPVGTTPADWELQVCHARDACLSALRVWNDPTARFRTSAFALLIITAWNGLAIGLLQRTNLEWRKIDSGGAPILRDGAEQSHDTRELIRRAFQGDDAPSVALRENVSFWVDLRNSAAHRHLPGLDLAVIPQAQACLVNIERVLIDDFGPEYSVADALTVPLQLSGFRDPGILASRKALLAGLPLDVKAVLNRIDNLPGDVASDPAFQIRVAFLPVVPASGRGADAVAYFVKPGELPAELGESLERYVVVPKLWKGGRWFRASEVAAEVERRTGYRFAASPHHSNAALALGVRPSRDETPRTIDISFAEYVSSFKQYQYTQAWIDRLVVLADDTEEFERVIGRPAVRVDTDDDTPAP